MGDGQTDGRTDRQLLHYIALCIRGEW